MQIEQFILEKYTRLSNIQYLELNPKATMQLIVGSNGCGKAQPLDAKIKVPGGWSTMGCMTMGATLTAWDGTPCTVTGVYYQGITPVYRVTLEDGRTTRVSDQHLWSVTFGDDFTPTVVTTHTLHACLNDSQAPSMWITTPHSEQKPPSVLPEDPYIIGCQWDGTTPLPGFYLCADHTQRRALLDGWLSQQDPAVAATGCVTLTNETQAWDLRYLIRSLGGSAALTHPSPHQFVVTFKGLDTPVRLRVMAIDREADEITQCISINHPDKLYVTDNFVVTHNSSILEELTPLPAHHSYFEKGGRKHIRVNHQSKTYVLDSVYNKGSGTHSFVCEDEELNSGGTFAIQKELVEEHFKLTREIHEVLIGVTPFTQMSTAKRREWLTRLTPTDMGYAFTLYNTVKSQYRDQLGVIKHITKRMARENQDLPDDGEIVRLRQTVKDLTTQLNGLFDQRERLGEKPFADNDALRRYVTDLRRRAETLLKKRVAIPPEWGVTSQDALDGVIEQTQADVQRQQGVLERMQDEYQQLQQTAPSKDERLSPKEIDDLRQTVKDKEATLTQRTEQVNAYQGLFPLVALPIDRNPKAMLENVVHAWLDLIESFPDNPEQYFTQQKGQACRERIDRNKAAYRQHDGKLNGALQRLSRLKGCGSVICPECQHKFQPGVSQADIEGLEKAKVHHQGEMTALEVVLKEDEAYLEAYEHYVSHVNRFRRLISETSLLAPVWHVCHQHNVMFVAPRDYRKDVLQWRDAMQTLLSRDLLASEVDILKHRLRYVDAIDQSTLTHHDQRMATLTRDIETATDALRQTQTLLNDQTACRARLQQLDNALTETIDAYQQVFDQLGVQQTHYFQQALTTETEHLQLQLAQTQERLSKVTLREGILTDLNQQLDQANETYKDLGLLVKSLSPTDGLIGRYLMGFMQNVVRMVNAVIGEIWTYPMEVLPSAMEKDELNYKFPLKINDGAMTTPDIGRGSSSQRDIVNFAFKLLVMKFLRIDGVPLYLDEFGSTFDEQHRLNLIPFVNQMIELNQIQQIFFISHFSATHGAFNHADICVLDPANITVPEHYNDHVVIR